MPSDFQLSPESADFLRTLPTTPPRTIEPPPQPAAKPASFDLTPESAAYLGGLAKPSVPTQDVVQSALITSSLTPQGEALRRTQLARDLKSMLGEDWTPAAVDPADAERRLRIAQNDHALRGAPRTSGFLLADPNRMAFAQDDIVNLAKIEKVVEQSGKSLWLGLQQAGIGWLGTAQSVPDTFSQILRAVGFPAWAVESEISKGLRAYAEPVRAYAKTLEPPAGASDVEAGYYSGLSSLSSNLINLPVGVLTRSSNLSAALMALTTYGQSYYKAVDEKGRDPITGVALAAPDAVAEYVTEKLGLKALFNIPSAKNGVMGFLRGVEGFARKELIGEEIATVWQDFNEWMVLNPGKTAAQFLQERPSAAVQTAVATLVGVGGQVAVVKTVEKLAGIAVEEDRARATENLLVSLFNAAAAAQTREKDPETFAAFMQEVGGDQPVYVAANVLGEALAKAGLTDDALPSYKEQKTDANNVGPGVEVPLGELVTAFAGTNVDTDVIPHIRLTPDALTLQEQRDTEDNAAAFFQAEVVRIATEAANAEQVRAEANQLRERAQTALDAAFAQFPDAQTRGFTRKARNAYASLLSQFYVVMADRWGVTPMQIAEGWEADGVKHRGYWPAILGPQGGSSASLPQPRTPLQAAREAGFDTIEPAYHWSQGGDFASFRPFQHFGTEAAAYTRFSAPADGKGLSVADLQHRATYIEALAKQSRGETLTDTEKGLLTKAAEKSWGATYAVFINKSKVLDLGGDTGSHDPIQLAWSIGKKLRIRTLAEDMVRDIVASMSDEEVRAWAAAEEMDYLLSEDEGFSVDEVRSVMLRELLDKQGNSRTPDGEFMTHATEQLFDAAPSLEAKAQKWLANLLDRRGITALSYVNDIEDPGSVSYIVPNPANVKSVNAKEFDTTNEDMLAQAQRTSWYYNQLNRAVAAAPAKLDGAKGKVWADWLRSNAGKLGVKKDELEATDAITLLDAFGDRPVSRQEVLALLDQNAIRIEEVVFEEVPTHRPATYAEYDKAPRFAKWQLPGGENYRELLLTLPQKEAPAPKTDLEARKQIFDAYADRLNDLHERVSDPQIDQAARDDALVEMHLLQEERDRRAAGAGGEVYDPILEDPKFISGHFPDTPNILAHIRFNERVDVQGRRVLFLEEIQSDWAQEGRKAGFADPNSPIYSVFAKTGAFLKSFERKVEADSYAESVSGVVREEKRQPGDDSRPPAAPFVTDTKAWTALALKRMIRYAAENGFDAIAWTTGEQQAERYDLSKQLNRIEFDRGDNDYFKVDAYDKNGGQVIFGKTATSETLPDIVGKELAQKMYDTPPGDKHVLTGLDLKVGGEGMKGYYDGIVPQVAGDLLKKLGGGKVETVTLPAKDRDPGNGWGSTGEDVTGRPATEQPGFLITDAMRAKAMQGVPLFQSQSSRVPTTKVSPDDHLGEVPLTVDYKLLPTAWLERAVAGIKGAANAPEVDKKTGRVTPGRKGYPGFRFKSRTASKQVEEYIEQCKSNLIWLYNQVPEDIRARARLWYDGGNRIMNEWSGKYGVTVAQASAVTAIFSPQRDWFQNVSFAERVFDIVKSGKVFPWTSQMDAPLERVTADDPALRAALQGKAFHEVEGLTERALWVALYVQHVQDNRYRVVTPEGGFGGYAQTARGRDRVLGMHPPMATYRAALAVIDDGSAANISDMLGGAHKVRSFYNNLFHPDSNLGFTTVDTHAVAAIHLMPLASSDVEVDQNFAKGEARTGLSAMYSLNQEAYTRAAKELGLLPREVQSITWEAVRGLFARADKAHTIDEISEIWRQYAKGKLTIDEARNAVLARAGGIAAPDWVGAGAGLDEGAPASSYTAELRGPQLAGDGLQAPVSAGSRGGDSGRVAGLGQRLLAPVDVESPEFRTWSGGAKLSSEGFVTGKPLVARSYHGTNAEDFTVFDPEKGGAQTGAESAEGAIWSTDSPRVASNYAENIGMGRFLGLALGGTRKYAGNPEYDRLLAEVEQAKKVAHAAWQAEEGARIAVVLSYLDKAGNALSQGDENLRRDTGRMLATVDGVWQKDFENLPERKALRAAEQAYQDASEAFNAWVLREETAGIPQRVMPLYVTMRNPLVVDAEGKTPAEFPLTPNLEKARRDGHDGVVIQNLRDPEVPATHFVVFKNTQVKSAISNTGEFSATDPNILAQQNGPATQPRPATLDDFTPENIGRITERTDWTILTAENQNGQTQSAEENAAQNATLEEELRARGLQYVEVKGKYTDSGVIENGFLVLGVDSMTAMHLGRVYNQADVVVPGGLLDQNGMLQPAHGVTVFDTEPENYYSRIPSTGAIFSINLDFDEARVPMSRGALLNGLQLKPVDVGSPEFKRWFGDSKVVDAEGRPLVAYHGTVNVFDAFRPNDLGLIFTSPDKGFANDYAKRGLGTKPDEMLRVAEQDGLQPNVMPVYVALNHPWDYRNPNHVTALMNLLREKGISDGVNVRVQDWHGESTFDADMVRQGDWAAIENKEVIDAIKELGHDGLLLNEMGVDNYVVFDPTQIKSAVSNTGEFSATDPNILAQQGKPGVTSAVGVHYSPEQRESLSSSAYGRGIKGAEAQRVAAASDARLRQRIHFYVDLGNGIRPEAGVGAFAHSARLENLYDLDADPLGLRVKSQANPGENATNTLESSILDAGFSGYLTRSFGDQGAVVMLGSQTVAVQPGVAPAEPPAPPKLSALDAQQEAIIKDRSLPAGQMTGVEWQRLLGDRVDLSHLDASAMYYKDMLLREPRQRAAEGLSQPADQGGQTGYRGSFNPDTMDLQLLAKADLSTFGHEVAHFFWTAMADMASYPDAPTELVNDVNAALAWMGVKGTEDIEAGAAGEGGTLFQGVSQATLKRQYLAVVKKHQGKDTWMKAPNGKPTKLSEDQWIIVRTPAFKAWFGDWEAWAKKPDGVWSDDAEGQVSKMVDHETKEPAVFYHGAPKRDFNAFDPGANTRGVGATFFTSSTRMALTYSGRRAEYADTELGDGDSAGASLFAVFLNIRNPQEESFEGANWDGTRSGQWRVVGEDGDPVYDDDGNAYFTDRDDAYALALRKGGDVVEADDFWASTDDVVRDAKRMKGVDGAVMYDVVDNGLLADVWEPSTIVAIFDGAQAKSAWGNTGAFARTDDNIFRQENEPTTPEGAQPLPKGRTSLDVWRQMTLEQQRPYHEKWAETWEQYLFTGGAPTKALRSLFRTFTDFMRRVYGAVKDFLSRNPNAALDPEIKAVMDRVVATHDEIMAAEADRNLEALFKSQVESGLSPADWAAYQKLPEAARAEAEEQFRARAMRDMKWLQNLRNRTIRALQKEAAAARDAVKAQVTKEVDAEPLWRAIRWLKTGEMVDANGEEVKAEKGFKLDLAAMQEMWPEGELAAFDWRPLGTGKYGMLGKDGLHPDLVAGMFGFSSGEALVKALLAAPSRKDEIEGRTDQRMLEEHGDLSGPAEIAQAADEAIHNDVRTRMVATELWGLRREFGSPAQIVRAARQYVEQMLSQRTLKSLKPWFFAAEERRAGKAAEEALRKGDRAKAAEHKRTELINHMAAKEAHAVSREMDKLMSRLLRIANAKDDSSMIKSRDPDMVAAVRAILAEFGIGRKGRPAREYLALVNQYAPDLGERLQEVIDDIADNAKEFKLLKIEQLRTLRESIESVWFLAKRSRQIEVDGKLMTLREAAVELRARLEEIGIPDTVPGEGRAVTPAEKRGMLFRSYLAALRRVEGWVDGKDGKPMGPFRKYIWTLVREGVDRYDTDKLRYLAQYAKLLDGIAPTLKPGLIEAPELGYVFGEGDGGIGKVELLHAILHTGNASNKRKLLLGRGWATELGGKSLDTSKWDAFLARMHQQGVLTKADYDFAQGVWDLLDSMKPAAQKTHRAVFGRFFDEVTADPVQTPFGEYRGGYVPAIADTDVVKDMNLKKLAESENESMQFAFPSTAKGFTKSRVEYNRPLKLDLRSIAQHIDKVLLFTHLTQPVNDVRRLVSNPIVAQALNRVDPEAIPVILTPWLNRAAKQIVEVTDPSDQGLGRFWSVARSRAGMTAMFANLANAVQQLTGFSLAALKVRPKYLGDALLQYVTSPKALAEFVREHSEYMAHRMENEVAQMVDHINEILINPSVVESARVWTMKHGYFAQTAMDNVISVVVWAGAFNEALETAPKEMSNEEAEVYARRLADAAVRQTQGAQQAADVAKFEVGSPFYRMFVQFAGYFNMNANLLGTEYARIMGDMGLKEGMGRGVYVFLLGFAIPAVVGELIMQLFKGGPPDEDKDGAFWDDWLAALFGWAPLRYLTAMVPGVGPALVAGANTLNNKPYDDRIQTSPAISMLESSVRAPVSIYKAAVDNGKASRAINDTATLVSMVTGLPARAVAKPFAYWADVAGGDVQPTGALDAVRGTITGAASPDSKMR